MKTGENIRQRADGRYEARYQKGRDDNGHIIYGYCYGKTYEEAKAKREQEKSILTTPIQLNLLVLGAGSHGLDVGELVKPFRIFKKVRYLDDNIETPDVIGKCTHFEKYRSESPVAIAAVGDAVIRKAWFESLVENGFIIPTLIHHSANIGAGVKIGSGSVICAGATIGPRCIIGKGCIIDSGAIVERDAVVPDWTLIPCGSVYMNSTDQTQVEPDVTERRL